MTTTRPKTTYLRDYKPCGFKIDHVSLEVDIFETFTQVRSHIKFHKAPHTKSLPTHLELDGEKISLKSVKFNGETLPPQRFQVSSEKLVILNIEEDEFELEIINTIDPENNISCEGFYRSGEQYCTQCEPEGFRKITYFLDRPDVMAPFRTRLSSDKKRFPYLLSNGNRIKSGELEGGRHFVEWEDPFKKPSYLFAMVAGDFEVARDTFTTMKGRKIDLEIYVDPGNLGKTSHAMESLKAAMKWDEESFGLEYDLDLYMIVAVDSFNMGAMENKGLNIFNSTYVLADQKSATDDDFQNIQAVIGHEYFHNWSGNRVTCRDWFQLTLKEGLTVYRDQEFSSDLLSRSVKRLEDVRLLKEMQFPEDQGPLAHPIRPSSYIEINNFYTRTIYEKGAEVIRMIETLIGKEKFRKGMDKYFELYDGMAVTTEDFIHAMEVASGRDLTQFKNWYTRPGTPTLKIKSHLENGEFVVEIQQLYPPTTHPLAEGNVLHMPFKMALLTDEDLIEQTLEIRELKSSFRWPVKSRPILSLNRGFSAPVMVEYDYEFSDLLKLMSSDTDAYCRYEATQKVYATIFKQEFDSFQKTGLLSMDLPGDFKEAFAHLLEDRRPDHSFKSYLLKLPTQMTLAQEMHHPDFDAIHLVHRHIMRKLAVSFSDWFLETYEGLCESADGNLELTPKAFGRRDLKNQILSYLVASGSREAVQILKEHLQRASNMTDEISALNLFVQLGVGMDHFGIAGFYDKWKNDSLVMLKWFSALAAHSPKSVVWDRLERLESDPLFQKSTPNYLRALYLQFARYNHCAFHAQDGQGYRYLAQKIKWMDEFNPNVASRAASAFSLLPKLDAQRQGHMRQALEFILEGKTSRDTYEVVSKYLSQ
jgi:aminopeptidase N